MLLKAIYCGTNGRFGMQKEKEYQFYLFTKKASTVKAYFKDSKDWFEYGSMNIFFNNFTQIQPLGNFHLVYGHKSFLWAEPVLTDLIK